MRGTWLTHEPRGHGRGIVAALKLAPLPNALSEKSRLGQKVIVQRRRRSRSNVSRGQCWGNQNDNGDRSGPNNFLSHYLSCFTAVQRSQSRAARGG